MEMEACMPVTAVRLTRSRNAAGDLVVRLGVRLKHRDPTARSHLTSLWPSAIDQRNRAALRALTPPFTRKRQRGQDFSAIATGSLPTLTGLLARSVVGFIGTTALSPWGITHAVFPSLAMAMSAGVLILMGLPALLCAVLTGVTVFTPSTNSVLPLGVSSSRCPAPKVTGTLMAFSGLLVLVLIGVTELESALTT